ncbi:MAG: hypothetical protein HOG51_04800 [Gammaproteobacteria bacterium]|nr:hypothetical protein [Gammaproteobacteria bacterium]MBT6780501.1 hypothetical protein [Porticoccaceae bacterium]MBT7563633.1 hypothetical protein [Porticoccaceae bacterium]MDC3364731.1 hypothetical protein [Pseudomonadales bacterium]
MKVELVESSGAGAALEEIKLIYGSDCLIVASVLKEEKHYTIVAIESEDEHKDILKSEESADGEFAGGLNLMIKDVPDVSELEDFGVKVPICTEKVNFRDILHNLTPTETMEVNSHFQDTESSNQFTNIKPAANDSLLESSPSEHIEAMQIDAEVADTVSAAALSHTEVPLLNVIDTSDAIRDRDQRFDDFKMSVSVNALEFAALLQNTIDKNQRVPETSDSNSDQPKL